MCGGWGGGWLGHFLFSIWYRNSVLLNRDVTTHHVEIVVTGVVVLVVVVNKEPKDDSAEATAEQSEQCAVCLASVNDEVLGVLDGDELLDTDGQGQVCLKTMIHKAPVIINIIVKSRCSFVMKIHTE